MSFIVNRGALAAITPLGLLLLAACQAEQPTSGPARFDGVVAADVSRFTSTPDRCTFSFLFDNFRVEWRPTTQLRPGQTGAEATRSFTLAVAAGARGKTAQFDIRGSYLLSGPAPGVSAIVSIGGKDHAITLPNGAEANEFSQRVEAVVPNDAEFIPVKIRTAIAKPQAPDTEALIDIDSVDLLLVAPGCGSTEATPNAASTSAPANSN